MQAVHGAHGTGIDCTCTQLVGTVGQQSSGRAWSGRSLSRMALMVDATKGVGTTMSSSCPCATTAARSPDALSARGSLMPCGGRQMHVR
jgi:hypothetical protein